MRKTLVHFRFDIVVILLCLASGWDHRSFRLARRPDRCARGRIGARIDRGAGLDAHPGACALRPAHRVQRRSRDSHLQPAGFRSSRLGRRHPPLSARPAHCSLTRNTACGWSEGWSASRGARSCNPSSGPSRRPPPQLIFARTGCPRAASALSLTPTTAGRTPAPPDQCALRRLRFRHLARRDTGRLRCGRGGRLGESLAPGAWLAVNRNCCLPVPRPSAPPQPGRRMGSCWP